MQEESTKGRRSKEETWIEGERREGGRGEEERREEGMT